MILPELNLEQVVVDQPTGLVINQPEQILNETILPVKTSRPSVRITATAMGVLNIKGLSERTSQNILQIQNSKVVTTTFTSSVFAKKPKVAAAYCGISNDPSEKTSEGEITSDTTTMVQIKQSEETHNDHGYTRPMTPPSSKGAPPLTAVSADPAKKIKVCKESHETKVNLL